MRLVITKIYDGLRFRSADLLEVHRQVMSFRPVIAKLTADAMASFLARSATERIDKAALDGESCDAPLFDSLDEFWDRERKIRETQSRDPVIDFEFKVFVLPFEGRVYGFPVSEQGKWVKALKAQDWVEEWGYWNNTDRPDHVTNEEWDERERVWHGILTQSPARNLAGCGLIADLTETCIPMVPDVLPHVPSLEERARRIAFNTVRARRFAHLVSEGANALGESLRQRDHIGAVIEAADYARQKGAAEVDAEAERLRTLLPEITEEILLGK